MSISKHTAYNLGGSLVPILLSLVTVPAYLHLIGAERYGILTIAWVLLGYFGLFDLGLGTATMQRIAGDADPKSRSGTLATALVVNLSIGVLGGALLFFGVSLFMWSMPVSSAAMMIEAVQVAPYLAACVPVATTTSVMTGALQGRERFLLTNSVSSISTAALQLVPLAFAWLVDRSLVTIVMVAMLMRAATMLVLLFLCWREFWRGNPARFEKSRAAGLLAFGGWVTVSSFVGPMMVVGDRFVIGAILGPVAVAAYSIPFQLAQRTLLLAASLSTALFPRLTSAGGAERLRLGEKGIKTIAAATTPLIAIALFAIEPFLELWVGKNIAAIAAPPGQVLLIGFWVNGLAQVPFAQILTAGKPRTTALIHCAELPAYMVLLWILLPGFGVIGAAIAFTIRCAVDLIVLWVINYGRTRPSGWILIQAAALGASAVAAGYFPVLSLYWLIAAALSLLITVGIGMMVAPQELVARLGDLRRGVSRAQG